MNTKAQIHELVDTIEDEEILNAYLQLIKTISNNKTGSLWDSLSTGERQDLLRSYDESFDNKNLISYDEVKIQHRKWLEE
ncbi:MAG TPA: hypothetical protein VGN64_21350 [Dyadobacter sp.]|jgi:hypothetical protein|nr:hypothetical protein [Dyadobacter sp.]